MPTQKFDSTHLLRWWVLPPSRPILSQTRRWLFLKTHRPICALQAEIGLETHLVLKRRRLVLPTIFSTTRFTCQFQYNNLFAIILMKVKTGGKTHPTSWKSIFQSLIVLTNPRAYKVLRIVQPACTHRILPWKEE